MQTIEAMTSERDRMDKIISILSGKADECFSKFCDILTKSNNEVWVKSLSAKAEEFKGGSGKTSPNEHAPTITYMHSQMHACPC